MCLFLRVVVIVVVCVVFGGGYGGVVTTRSWDLVVIAFGMLFFYAHGCAESHVAAPS